jgi:heme a synthase
MRTPLGFLAERFTLSPRALRWATTAALLVSIVIVFTGGLVRVTGSGLGCPTWPTCEGSSIAPSAALGIHGVIEFANRVFTTVIVLAVGWVIIAARLQKPRVRAITRLAWSQFWLVVANAIAGGITVLVKLNPWVVALHFLLAIALLATTTITWHRVREKPTRFTPSPTAQILGWALISATAALVIVGTLVSGTGPHSGDSADVPRIGLDWKAVTITHGIIAVVVIVLAIVLLVVVRSELLLRRRLVTLLIVLAAQAFVGILQAISGLPEALVSFHLLGAALVWVGALRVLLDLNPRGESASSP